MFPTSRLGEVCLALLGMHPVWLPMLLTMLLGHIYMVFVLATWAGHPGWQDWRHTWHYIGHPAEPCTPSLRPRPWEFTGLGQGGENIASSIPQPCHAQASSGTQGGDKVWESPPWSKLPGSDSNPLGVRSPPTEPFTDPPRGPPVPLVCGTPPGTKMASDTPPPPAPMGRGEVMVAR